MFVCVVNLIFALRERDNKAFLSLKLSYTLLLYSVIIVKMKLSVNTGSYERKILISKCA